MSFAAIQRAYDNQCPPAPTREEELIDERMGELRNDLALMAADEAIEQSINDLLNFALDYKAMTDEGRQQELRALSWRVEKAIKDRAERDVRNS